MFVEPYHNRQLTAGWIEVICGSMFSGKTEELLRRVRRLSYASRALQAFKPSIDKRYNSDAIVSHDQQEFRSHVVAKADEIVLLLNPETEVVVVDEAQFFDERLPAVCTALANEGKRVIVAGLDMDYAGTPFGVMPVLLSQAEYITKLHAICVCCGQIAQYTYRKIENEERVLVGTVDVYEPRCRQCYKKG